MTTDLREYSTSLAEQLRLNGMKEEQVREVVAEVQAHVVATQEGPLTAFGQPADYARTWIDPPLRRWILRMVGGVVGVTGIVTLQHGIFGGAQDTAGTVAFTGDDAMLWVVWVLGLAVVPWSLQVWWTRRHGQRLGQRRSLSPLALGMGALVVITVLAWVVVPRLVAIDHVVFTSPRWLVLAIGLCCLPGFGLIGRPSSDALPGPPGPDTWKSRLRRAFWTR